MSPCSISLHICRVVSICSAQDMSLGTSHQLFHDTSVCLFHISEPRESPVGPCLAAAACHMYQTLSHCNNWKDISPLIVASYEVFVGMCPIAVAHETLVETCPIIVCHKTLAGTCPNIVSQKKSVGICAIIVSQRMFVGTCPTIL